MNKEKVEEEVLRVFEKFTGQQEVNVNCYIFTDIELDSLDLIEIVMEIEDVLDISIDNDMFDKCRIVQDIVDMSFDLVKDK